MIEVKWTARHQRDVRYQSQARSRLIIIQYWEENHDLMSEGKTNGAALTEMATKSLVINACYIQDYRSWIVLLLRQAYAVTEHECGVESDAKTMLSRMR